MRVRRRVGNRVPCGCFGGRETVSLQAALVRNAAIGALAGFLWASATDALAVAWPALPRQGDALPMLLSLGGVAAAVLATWRASVWLGRGSRT